MLRGPCSGDTEKAITNERLLSPHPSQQLAHDFVSPLAHMVRLGKTRMGVGGVASTARGADALLCVGKCSDELVMEVSLWSP